jgi:NAD(P)-dependent dehydrogenase (short-subunit alcohol dehydrogenase family)
MSRRFVGSKVLVTGAGSNGLGRAIALAFAREGADLVVHYHSDPDAAATLINDIDRSNRAIALQADLSNPVAGRNLVRQAAERLGGIDVVVAAAGTTIRKSVVDTTDQDWANLFAVNLTGSFACVSEAAKIMLAADRPGRIILIGSVLQQLALANRAAYGASKGGLLQLARCMALELAPKRITVNVIAPGTIITDMNRSLQADPDWVEKRLVDIPMGRFGEPDDVVEAALFLAGPGAAYITGNTIFCDGGMALP